MTLTTAKNRGRLGMMLIIAGAAFLGALTPSRVAAASCNAYLWFDAAPDALSPLPTVAGQLPQLDITEGDFGLTPDHAKLRVVLTVPALSTTLPNGASESDYQVFWNFGSTAAGPTTYATDVNVIAGGIITYSVGKFLEVAPPVVGTTTQYVQTNVETGSFAAGRVEVDVPLADIGNPQIGDTLTLTGGFTATGAGALGQGQEFFVDFDPGLGPPQTFGNNYKLGQATCIDPGSVAVVTPEAPLTAVLLVTGGIAAVGALGIRRRRRISMQ